MTGKEELKGAYGVNHDIVDYILGITYEIWEEGNIELCHQYYGADTLVYGLDGITHGAAAVVEGTRNMLKAFPDRLLLGDDVITHGDCHRGYSSHRVVSPAVNLGDSIFGPATGKPVRFMNMADCVVEDGVVTLEWLARDNLAVVRQLGFDPLVSAQRIADNRSIDLEAWFASETDRVAGRSSDGALVAFEQDKVEPFASAVVGANWISGSSEVIEAAYAPYAVAHRSPIETISGRTPITDHYASLRSAFNVSGASVDHLCVQRWGEHGHRVAVRWAIAGTHRGVYQGIAPTGKPVYIMGVSHWRIVDGRIACEWTVFDSLAVMGQLLQR